MRKVFVAYVIISIVALVFFYFFTVIQVANKRSHALFLEIGQEAKNTNDFDHFVKFQSVAFVKLDLIENDDYYFHFYQLVAKIQEEHINQFAVFVMPKGQIDYAKVITDLDDKTQIVITNKTMNQVVYDSSEDPVFEGLAISYPVNDLGFYYYAFALSKDMNISVELFDYYGVSILDEVVDFGFIEFEPTDLGVLSLGYTEDEIEVLLDLENHLKGALIRNVSLYIVGAVFIGAILHLIAKRKN